jgi:hypothetical protein
VHFGHECFFDQQQIGARFFERAQQGFAFVERTHDVTLFTECGRKTGQFARIAPQIKRVLVAGVGDQRLARARRGGACRTRRRRRFAVSSSAGSATSCAAWSSASAARRSMLSYIVLACSGCQSFDKDWRQACTKDCTRCFNARSDPDAVSAFSPAAGAGERASGI